MSVLQKAVSPGLVGFQGNGSEGNPFVPEISPVGDGYVSVSAGQTNVVIGANGAVGDYLVGLLCIPASTSPGAISIKDGSGTAITVFAGGGSSLSNLVPFTVALGVRSVNGGWKVTTGANISVIAVGRFTA